MTFCSKYPSLRCLISGSFLDIGFSPFCIGTYQICPDLIVVRFSADDEGLTCIGVQPFFKGCLFDAEDSAHLDGRKALGTEQLIHAAAADVHNCHNVFGGVENGSVLHGCCGCLCCIHICLPLSFVIFMFKGHWDNGVSYCRKIPYLHWFCRVTRSGQWGGDHRFVRDNDRFRAVSD